MVTIKELFAAIRRQINEKKDECIEGLIKPFELYRELIYTKICIDQAKDELDEIVKNEFAKYAKEELKEMGISMSVGGNTYKYDHIPEWVEQKEKLTIIEDRAKAAFIQSQKNVTVFDNETGCMVVPTNATPRKQSIIIK